jgi:hypothetical protein
VRHVQQWADSAICAAQTTISLHAAPIPKNRNRSRRTAVALAVAVAVRLAVALVAAAVVDTTTGAVHERI